MYHALVLDRISFAVFSLLSHVKFSRFESLVIRTTAHAVHTSWANVIERLLASSWHFADRTTSVALVVHMHALTNKIVHHGRQMQAYVCMQMCDRSTPRSRQSMRSSFTSLTSFCFTVRAGPALKKRFPENTTSQVPRISAS